MVNSVVKTAIFTILVPGTVTVVIPHTLASDGTQPSHLSSIGFLPMAMGVAIYLWCAWDFASAGRGTPAPIDPPKVLVARGLYRFVRNPMYVGVVLILAGESVTFQSARIFRYTLLTRLFFHLFVMFYEEPVLKHKFGTPYQDYLNKVNRRLPRSGAVR